MSEELEIEEVDSDEGPALPNDVQTLTMEWFKEKVEEPACQSCGREAWLISPNVHTYPAVDTDTGGILFDEGLTLVMLICSECGYTRSYSANMIGIAD